VLEAEWDSNRVGHVSAEVKVMLLLVVLNRDILLATAARWRKMAAEVASDTVSAVEVDRK
jgi:hypothetical protein